MMLQNPEALWLLLILPAVYILYRLAQKRRRKDILKFSSLGVVKKAADKRFRLRKHLSFILIAASLALLVIGLSDPHIPLEREREGVNVVLAIDVSGSMNADDYKPTRLEAAKRSAEILLKELEPKDHAGIVIFESGATTTSYLSPFKQMVMEKLRSIAPKEGRTAIGDGLSLAVDMAISIPNKKKVVILLSDGVNNAGVISPEEAVAFARTNDIQVFTIGMGSEEDVVLGYDLFGRPQYAQLDEETLKAIAEETGGRYYRSVDSDTLDQIYRSISENIEREKEQTSIKDWIIGLAILLLLAELYFRYGRFRVLTQSLLIMVLLSSVASAQLTVEKSLQNDTVQAGDDVKILLEFKNGFSEDLPIEIQDTNIFGNNGVQIECLEYMLPAGQTTVLGYEPITAYKAGGYELDPATVSYTNPETGKEESVTSNSLSLEIGEGASGIDAEGITKVYQCNGVRSVQRSSVSGSSMSVSVGSQGQMQQAMDQQMNRLSNNQMDQDAGALKSQMQEEIQEKEQMERTLRDKVENSDEFERMEDELLQQGYSRTGSRVDPQSGSSGDFSYEYESQGKEASLEGEMDDGRIQSITQSTQGQPEDLRKILNTSEEFREADQDLRSKGMEPASTILRRQDNTTHAELLYSSDQANATIRAVIVNETVQDISVQEDSSSWWIWLVIFALIAIILSYLGLRKPSQEPPKPKPADPRKEALGMLDEAAELYGEGKHKEAFAEVSYAVRFYTRHLAGIDHELTNTECVDVLKHPKDVKRCLATCSMVEFARQEPGKKEFDKALQAAEKFVKDDTKKHI